MSQSPTTEIRVSGMHCDSCVRRLTKVLSAVPDTKVVTVEVGLVEVDLANDSARQKVVDAIVGAGFGVDG